MTPLSLASLPLSATLVELRSGRRLDAPALQQSVAAASVDLAARGLPPGARIVLGQTDPLDVVVSLFAAWAAGLVAVAVNPNLPGPEQLNVVAATGASDWLGPRRTALAFAPHEPTPGATPVPLDADAPALILMTSGTTGRPKGIVHSRHSLGARIAHNIAAIGTAPMARTLCVLPVFFGHGLIGNVLTPLWAGGTVWLWPTPDLAELRGLTGQIERNEIGFMSSVPSFWKLALRVAPPPNRPLERIHVGSAPLALGLWQQIAEWGGTRQVFNMFGMTETANWIGGGSLDAALTRDGFVGQPWGGDFAIRTDAGAIVREGRGEVLLRSPSIMLGYWERPDLDAEAFVDGWFRTGDVGELEPDGALTLVGRIKSEINRGGIKVQAEEIDMLLERHPDIAEACAFGIPDPAAGEAVAAAVVLRDGAVFDPEAIKAWCRDQVRAEAVPSRLHAVPAIPRNDRGKIVRAEVRRLVEAG